MSSLCGDLSRLDSQLSKSERQGTTLTGCQSIAWLTQRDGLTFTLIANLELTVKLMSMTCGWKLG